MTVHINYQTHLATNLFSIQQIADRFHIGFLLRYRELHSFLYGEANYRNGVLSDVTLTAIDFAGYHFDQQQKQFIYKIQAFNWEEELIENFRPDSAAYFAKLRLRLSADLKYTHGKAILSRISGELNMSQGKIADAKSQFETALAAFENVGDQKGHRIHSKRFGYFSSQAGDLQRSFDLLSESTHGL